MKIPSKVTPYKESTIAKFPVILSLLEQNDMTRHNNGQGQKQDAEDRRCVHGAPP